MRDGSRPRYRESTESKPHVVRAPLRGRPSFDSSRSTHTVLMFCALASRVIPPLGVTLELSRVEIHFPQVAGAVSFCLIVEVP